MIRIETEGRKREDWVPNKYLLGKYAPRRTDWWLSRGIGGFGATVTIIGGFWPMERRWVNGGVEIGGEGNWGIAYAIEACLFSFWLKPQLNWANQNDIVLMPSGSGFWSTPLGPCSPCVTEYPREKKHLWSSIDWNFISLVPRKTIWLWWSSIDWKLKTFGPSVNSPSISVLVRNLISYMDY